MELAEVDLGGGGHAAGRSSSEPATVRGRVSSSADSLAEEDEAADAAVPSAATGRPSRASSMVSGLLVELYSVGRPRHRDSVDSSTEASAGSDAFPGGRSSSAGSRVLQELQRRPNQRHQRTYLAQRDTNELMTIMRELNYRICVQSSKLLRLLKQKDRLLHKVQKNCDIVTACLQAVSQKRRKLCLYVQFIIRCRIALMKFSKCFLCEEG
uniref:Uncharacterized protein n=1 Tax=Sphaerodactylus townsendi TaxID=933632 RepID=A0ACB8FP82_9SAUR